MMNIDLDQSDLDNVREAATLGTQALDAARKAEAAAWVATKTAKQAFADASFAAWRASNAMKEASVKLRELVQKLDAAEGLHDEHD